MQDHHGDGWPLQGKFRLSNASSAMWARIKALSASIGLQKRAVGLFDLRASHFAVVVAVNGLNSSK